VRGDLPTSEVKQPAWEKGAKPLSTASAAIRS
jgi:hypothetical protein